MSQGPDPAPKISQKPADDLRNTRQSEDIAEVSPVQASASMPATPVKDLTKKEAEAPEFEKGIIDRLVKEFGNRINVLYIRPLRIKIAVEPAEILAIAIYIRDALGFDHAESVAGTDYPKDNQIEVIYHLGSYGVQELEGHILALATRTSRNEASLPSLINIFRSVEYHERETYEMLGVYFEGHPRNDRFLLPEDWADIPPLRREFRIKGR
jgi:NADH-quinone oxidoreductase subunit C